LEANTQAFSLRPLDRNFVGAKPIESAEPSVVAALEDQGRLIIERKRNGNAAFISVTGESNHNVGLYSRSIHELTHHFPSMVDELRSIGIPNDTLLSGELLAQVEGVDSPEKFGEYARSKPARAVALQLEGEPIRLSLFNVIVHKGKSVIHLPYEDRLDILRETLHRHSPHQVNVVEVLDVPFAQATARSIASKWEGLVLYDAKAGSTFRLNGRHDLTPRPEGCWKWKDYLEGDFVATGWIPSTAASHAGLVKDLEIAQYDPITRELVPWGKVGIGISKQQRQEFTDPSLYPMVFEILFERRTVNKRLIHARILRRRFDKGPEECIAPIEYAL
jgi:ATP-dependent DNA ligase